MDHRHFAIASNSEVWSLLDRSERTDAENAMMLHAAHASCYHWIHAGTPVEHQRGEWLLARVNAALGHGGEALRHAERCFALTQAHKELMRDFDIAYAHEAMARALTLTGDDVGADSYRAEAERLGAAIEGEEDRRIFQGDIGATL